MAEFANDSINGLEELNKALQGTKEELQEIIKLQNQRAKDIDLTKAQAKEMTELAKAAQQVAKAEQQIEIINEKQAKTQIQLEKVRAEELKTAQQKQKLDVSQAKEKERLNKLAEKERKNAEKLNGEYAKQSKELNDLRKKYKNMRLEAGKSTDETEDLRKEIEKLDKTLKDVDAEVGQFQRNVGNYPKAAGQAKSAFLTLGAFLSGVMVSAFGKSRKASRELQVALERISNVAKIVFTELVSLFTNQIIPSISNVVNEIVKAKKELELKITYDDEEEKKLEDDIKRLNKEIQANTESMDNYNFSLERILDTYNKTDSSIQERLENEDRLIDRTAKLNDEIQKLQITEQVLEARIGNSNFSFAERQAQIDALIDVQSDIIDKEKELAQLTFDNIAQKVQEELLRAGEIKDKKEISKEDIKKLDFLKKKNLADALELDTLNELTAATTTLNEVEAKRKTQRELALKERLDDLRDEFEQQLDFTLDISDRQKSVNERQIASDQLTVKEKFKTLAETEGLLNRSYKEQLRLTEDFIKESVALRKKDATPEEQAKLQEALNNLDLDRIVNLKDEKEIRKELIDSGVVDEKVNQRIREIIIERIAALQDVKDLNEEVLAQAREEQMTQEDAEFALSETRRQIAADNAEFRTEQRIEDFEEEEKFNQAKLDNAKKALEDQKELETELFLLQKSFELERAETEEDRLRIEAEIRQGELEIDRKYYEALEDLDNSAKEKQIQNAEDVLQEKADIFNKLTSALQEQLNRQTEAVLSQSDKEIEDREKSVARQEMLASQGLDNQYVFEEKKLAEANLRKIELEKEQARKEELLRLSQIFGEAYIARLQGGESSSQALAGATSDAFLYKAIAESIFRLPAFYEGTESVKDSLGSPIIDGKDGYVIRVDGQERILNPEHSRMVKGLTNKELAQAGLEKKLGATSIDNKEVVSELKKLNNKPIQQIDIDKLGNIIETLDSGKMKTRTRLKTRGRL